MPGPLERECFYWRYRGLLGPHEWGGNGIYGGLTAGSTVHSSGRVLYSTTDYDDWIYANSVSDSLDVGDLNGVAEHVYEVPQTDLPPGFSRSMLSCTVGVDDNVYALTAWTYYVYDSGTATYTTWEPHTELWRFDTSNASDTGTLLATWDEAVSTPWSAMLRFSQADGNFYYADDGNGKVWRVGWGTWTRTALTSHSTRSPYTGEFGPDPLYEPISVANDGAVWYYHGPEDAEGKVQLRRLDPNTGTFSEYAMWLNGAPLPHEADSVLLWVDENPSAYWAKYLRVWEFYPADGAIVAGPREDMYQPAAEPYWWSYVDGAVGMVIGSSGDLWETDWPCSTTRPEPEFVGRVPWGSLYHAVSQDGQWVYGLMRNVDQADSVYRAPISDPSNRTILAPYNEEFAGEVAVDPVGNFYIVAIRYYQDPANGYQYYFRRVDKITPAGVTTTVFPEQPGTHQLKMIQRWDDPSRAYVLHGDDYWSDTHIYDMDLATGSYVEVDVIPEGVLGHAMPSVGWQTGTDGSLWYNGYHLTDWASSLSVWRWDPVTHEINNSMATVGGQNLGGYSYDQFYCQLIPLEDGKMGMVMHDDYWFSANESVTVGGIITHEGGDNFSVVYERGLNYFPVLPETTWQTYIDGIDRGNPHYVVGATWTPHGTYFLTEGDHSLGNDSMPLWFWGSPYCQGTETRVSAAVSFSYPTDVGGVYWNSGYYMLHLVGLNDLSNPVHLASLGSEVFSAATGWWDPEWGPGDSVDYIALSGRNAWKDEYLIVGNQTNPIWFVVDCSDPTAPVIAHVEQVDTEFGAFYWTGDAYEVVRNRLYLAGNGPGHTTRFIVYDITDPVAPVLLGSTTLPGRPTAVVALDNHVLVTEQFGDNGSGRVWSIDVSDPAAPSLVSTVQAGIGDLRWNPTLIENLLYVRAESGSFPDYEDRIVPIDVSDPTALTVAGTPIVVVGSRTYGDISSTLNGNLLVPDGSGDDGLRSVDAVTGAIYEVSLGDDLLRYAWDHAQDLVLDRFRLVTSSGFDGTIKFVVLDLDVIDGEFDILGYANLPALTDDGDTYTGGITSINTICVPNGCWNWQYLGDLPGGSAQYGVVTPPMINSVAAVVTNQPGWYEVMDDYRLMQLVDFSVPENPLLRGFITLRQVVDAAIEPRPYYGYYDGSDPADIPSYYTFDAGAWTGSLFYMAAADGNWDENFLVDCSDIDNPIIVATHKTGGTINASEPLGIYGIYTTAVAIAGTTMILGGSATQFRDPDMQQGAKTLAKYDITDISNPVYVDHIHWAGQQGRFTSIIVDGNVAYAISPGWPNGYFGPDTGSLPCVHSIDIPTWTLLGTVNLHSTFDGLINGLGEAVLVGTELHVKSNRSDGFGIFVVDISDPSNMAVVDGYGTPSNAYNPMDLIDGKVLAAAAPSSDYALFDPSIDAYDDSQGGIVAGPGADYFDVLSAVPGYPNFEGGMYNLGYRSLGDGEHVFTQLYGTNGPPDYGRSIWGFFVFKIGDTKPVAPNRWEHVGTALMGDFDDYDPAWDTGIPSTLMESPINAHVNPNFNFAAAATSTQIDFTNPRVVYVLPGGGGSSGDVTIWGDNLIVQGDGEFVTVDPTTGVATHDWGDFSTGTTGCVDDSGYYYWWTYRMQEGYVVTDPIDWSDIEYLQQSTADWSDTVSPHDVNIAPDGRIWGMSDSRDFWVWNADGTIWRHFNANATGGGDPRWPDAPLATAFDPDNPQHVYMLGDDGVFFADMADPAYIRDDWPERTADGFPDYPGEYTVLFDRLLAFETPYSSWPPAEGYDFPSGTIGTMDAALSFFKGRLYLLDAGHGTWPEPYTSAVWSFLPDGSDLTQEWSVSSANSWITSMDIGPGGDVYLYSNGTSEILHFPPAVTVPYTGRKVFYSSGQDNAIYSASYPALVDLNIQDWGYAYIADRNDGAGYRYGWGMALAGTKLYFLVERGSSFSRPSGAEIWEFDTSNPNDTGTIVYEDDDELGAGSGTMRGHMVYNHADDRLYIAEGYGYSDTTPFVEYHTSLIAIDRTTWTREELLTFTGPDVSQGSIILTGDLVWFISFSTGGTAESIHVYDISSGYTTNVSMAPFDRIVDPHPLDYHSVLLWDDNVPLKFTFDGVSITSTSYPLATLGDYGPFWAGTYGDGAPGSTWGFDSDGLWVYNTVCPGGFGPTVGWIGFSGTF